MNRGEEYLDEEVLDLEALKAAHEERNGTEEAPRPVRFEREPPPDDEEDDSARYYRRRRSIRRRRRMMAQLLIFAVVFVLVGAYLYLKRR